MTWPLILVVDDDEVHVELLCEVLALMGYRVATACGGDTVAVARREQPRLILLDIQMPEMSGGEVARLLRADPATAAIPIVAVSASPHLLADHTLPVNDRLEKPFQLTALSEVVGRWTTPVAAQELAYSA